MRRHGESCCSRLRILPVALYQLRQGRKGGRLHGYSQATALVPPTSRNKTNAVIKNAQNLKNMTDDVETRRRRALYRAMHRGTKEMDHLVGRYADAYLPAMTLDGLAHFERFLALPDPLLQGWFFGTQPVGSPEFDGLVREMRRFHGLEDRS